MNKQTSYEDKIKKLDRVKILAREKVLFKPYFMSKKDRFILLNFNKMSAIKLAQKLKVNRSYVYAVVEKFRCVYTKDEIRAGFGLCGDALNTSLAEVLATSQTPSELRQT